MLKNVIKIEKKKHRLRKEKKRKNKTPFKRIVFYEEEYSKTPHPLLYFC